MNAQARNERDGMKNFHGEKLRLHNDHMMIEAADLEGNGFVAK
jgi:hypothetical protein